MYPRGNFLQCIDVNIPPKDYMIGIPNSDLHLYITYIDDIKSLTSSTANFCSIDPVYQRPNFGRIKFNLNILRQSLNNNQKFQDRLETTIHEILHILGFSSSGFQYWIDPQTKEQYGDSYKGKLINTYQIRNINTDFLQSQNILKTTKKYYDCDSIQGMQLENQGGSISVGSHWEKTILVSEIMNSEFVQTQTILSVFTVALLKDTGFYQDVNENFSSKKMKWGKGKGCQFFSLACQENKVDPGLFPEFVNSQIDKGCTFDNVGYGTGIKTVSTDGCFYMAPYTNKICTIPQNNLNTLVNDRMETFGNQSRCFKSTLSTKNYIFQDQTRCHQFSCNEDSTQVKIYINQLNKEFVCKQPGEVININFLVQDIKGTITCPNDFSSFCDYEPICKNFCSSNGICVKGFCICKQGFSDEDCSIKCNNLSQNGTCVDSCSQGYFSSMDNTCRPTCFKGFYKDFQNQICQQCNSSCSECTGPSEKECTSCQFLTYLDDNICVEECPKGKYKDDNQKKCIACTQIGCLQCDSQSCLECDQRLNYELKDGKCIKSRICDQNCLACTQNLSECTVCQKGLFLNIQTKRCVVSQYCPINTFANNTKNECSLCTIEGCSKCLTETICDECNQEQSYRKIEQICTKCIYPCSTCQIDDNNKCLSCEDQNLVLFDGQCVQNCPQGTYLDFGNKQCQKCILQGCTECSSNNICKMCDAGYYLIDNKCIKQQCDSKCHICNIYNNQQCEICKEGYLFYFGECVKDCPDETFENKNTKKCEWCQYGCLKCINEIICQECDGDFGYELDLEKKDCYQKY